MTFDFCLSCFAWIRSRLVCIWLCCSADFPVTASCCERSTDVSCSLSLAVCSCSFLKRTAIYYWITLHVELKVSSKSCFYFSTWLRNDRFCCLILLINIWLNLLIFSSLLSTRCSLFASSFLSFFKVVILTFFSANFTFRLSSSFDLSSIWREYSSTNFSASRLPPVLLSSPSVVCCLSSVGLLCEWSSWSSAD